MNDQRGRGQLPLFDLPPTEKAASALERTRQDSAGSPRRSSGSKAASAAKQHGRKAYLFRVVLKWDRKVWRTIVVRGDQTLHHLHLAIQDAFGWDDDHMYSFFMSGKRWDPATEYADPRAEDGRKATQVRIGALRLEPRRRFLYLYDYGDELLHEVWLVGAGPAAAGLQYPRLVKAHGEPPPQNPAFEEGQ